MKVLAVRNRPTNNSTQSPALCARQRCRVRLRGRTVTSSVGTRRRCGQSRGSVRAQRFLPARTESGEMERGATECHPCTEMLPAAAAGCRDAGASSASARASDSSWCEDGF